MKFGHLILINADLSGVFPRVTQSASNRMISGVFCLAIPAFIMKPFSLNRLFQLLLYTHLLVLVQVHIYRNLVEQAHEFRPARTDVAFVGII